MEITINNTLSFDFTKNFRENTFTRDLLLETLKGCGKIEDVTIEEENYDFDVSHFLSGCNLEEMADKLYEAMDELYVLGDDELMHLQAYIEAFEEDDILFAIEDFENYMFYPYYSLGEIAEEVADDLLNENGASDFERRYFDYDAFREDLDAWEVYYECWNGVIEKNKDNFPY